MKYSLLFVLFVCLQRAAAAIYHLNELDYARMPPLFHLDQYESCMRRGGLYCTVDFTVVSDEPSELLDLMKDHSAVFTHYNHTNPRYGLCVTDTCNYNHQLNTTEDLNGTLEACLNKTFWERYRLKTRVNNDFSCTRRDDEINVDLLDILIAVVLLAILAINVVGSFYGFLFTDDVNKGNAFLTSFSVRHNWKTLVAEGSGFKVFSALRTIVTCLVIFLHAQTPFIINADNPEYVEQVYHNDIFLLLLNGTPVVQVFILMSVSLLAYKMEMHREKHAVSWAMVLKTILLRWLRLTPVYAVLVAVNATWMRHVGSGPLWETVFGAEIKGCRYYGWLNLLYLNNYIDNKECMGQSWYLAADMQLYILGVLILTLVQSRQGRKVVLSLMFVVGLITPTLPTYFLDLPALLILSPEMSRGFFMHDATFNHVYKRGHTNLAGAAVGLAFGLLLHRLQKKNFTLDKYTRYRWVCWGAVPAAFLVVHAARVFFLQLELPVLVKLMYAAFAKPLFVIFIAIFAFGIIFKIETACRRVLEWRGWRVPARLSYSAYLLHILVVKSLVGVKTNLVHTNLLLMAETSVATIVITYIIAVFLWLLVEAPCSAVVRLATAPRTSEGTKKGKMH